MPDIAMEDRRLVITIFYEGPWDRAATWLWAVDPVTLSLRREVRPGTLRDRLAGRCDDRNRAWINRYARRGMNPPDRWKRRSHGV